MVYHRIVKIRTLPCPPYISMLSCCVSLSRVVWGWRERPTTTSPLPILLRRKKSAWRVVTWKLKCAWRVVNESLLSNGLWNFNFSTSIFWACPLQFFWWTKTSFFDVMVFEKLNIHNLLKSYEPFKTSKLQFFFPRVNTTWGSRVPQVWGWMKQLVNMQTYLLPPHAFTLS